MAKVDRKYWIVERGTTDQPPQNDPILVDEQGREVDLLNKAIFNKASGNWKKVDHYRIRFEIKERGPPRLRFAPNEADVLWTKKGGGASNCPTTACYDLKYEFWVDDMHSNGKWIDVINMDLEPTEFWFTLNLVAMTNVGGPFVPVDPPGDNRNGGGAGSGFTSSALLPIGLGICAGVVTFLGAELLFRG